MENEKVKIPKWFWAVAIFFLLWNIMGLLSFFSHTFISDEALAALPANERELYDDYPMWTTIIFAIAVLGGFLGAVFLVLKKKWAKMAFIISLLAIIPQMIHNVFFTKSIEVYGQVETATMPAILVIFSIFLVWFSMLGIKKHWLR
ncbi:MAG: hypothetical protein DRJ01_16200 [Bacteroidetes bacterium]|nr:MAG: hypothetical protein DRJ01_16200 [Bacteroidota bacterium]